MESTVREKPLGEEILKNLYQGWQKIKAGLSLAHKNLSSQLRQQLFPDNLPLKQVSEEAWQILQQRVEQVIEEDWRDAMEGIYPVSLLFDADWGEFFQAYIGIWLDYPRTWQRIRLGNFQDLPSSINLDKYPAYYRRNFHYQSDGYLSEYSANLYDLQVDILFNGIADGMRRRVLKPLKQALQSQSRPRILDVACGTGRTLKFLRYAFPEAQLYGIDLSAFYLRKANEMLLRLFPQQLPQLVEGNAEHLPYRDNYFHGVTTVFLFHELPSPVRQRVINECYRVLQPGGVLVIADSIQLSDSPQLEAVMYNFSTLFHEPFYNDYIKDDFQNRLLEAGFDNIQEKVYGLSKYWIATKRG